jgi:Na+/proline symporter
LFVYYQVFPNNEVAALVEAGRTDYIFPQFIKTVLGPGLRGLLIAGLLAAAMSSLDSALNALSSTVYVDFYRPFSQREKDEKHAVRVSRAFVVMFAVLLAGIAVYFSRTESILWLGFRIFGYTYGGLLGIFLLAVITRRRGNDAGNIAALLSSVGVVIFLTADSVGTLAPARALLLGPFGLESFAWPWAIVIGMVWAFGVGVIFRTKSNTEVQKQKGPKVKK